MSPGDAVLMFETGHFASLWRELAERMSVRPAEIGGVRDQGHHLVVGAVANIAVIDPPQHGPERSDPGGLLCQMLVRHGVRAEDFALHHLGEA